MSQSFFNQAFLKPLRLQFFNVRRNPFTGRFLLLFRFLPETGQVLRCVGFSTNLRTQREETVDFF